MPDEGNKKLCFVIAPIGEEGSEVRRRSDQVLNHIMTPAAEECGYQTLRADEMSEPGMITSQVIQHLLDDPLVIADLTDRNPNVFYELAIRHAVRQPVVQVIQRGEPVPFDVAQSRTIQVDHRDLDSAARCREELTRQIRSVEKDPSQVDTPISIAIDLQSMHQSENPLERSSAEIMSVLLDIRSKIEESDETPRRFRLHPGIIEEFGVMLDHLDSLLLLEEDEEPSRAKFEEAHQVLHRVEDLLQVLMMESGMPSPLIDGILGRRHRRRRHP